jgi:hypothetical protein
MASSTHEQVFHNKYEEVLTLIVNYDGKEARARGHLKI